MKRECAPSSLSFTDPGSGPAARAVFRREFLKRTGLTFGAMALGSLLNPVARAGISEADPLEPRAPHVPPRARHVIYLHMVGAPSQLDLLEWKPELVRRNGELCPSDFIEGKRFAFIRGHPRLLGTRYRFDRRGRSGVDISELLPHLGRVADEIAVVKSLHTDEFNHGPAQAFLHTGASQLGRPSLGSWITYGLGTLNKDLPAYVVMVNGADPGAGSSLWSNGFLPSVYQGIKLRSSGDPILFLSNPAGQTRNDRRRLLDTIEALNREQLNQVGDPEIVTRINQYEMAFRMQASVPDLMDISGESSRTLELYGARPGKASFANSCLLARRLVEKGVRIVQIYNDGWDHHSNLQTALPNKCREVDQPMAALVSDLKQRGLLDETVVVWGGEFGRTPMLQSTGGDGNPVRPGRDHHKDAFAMWMAGGGVKGGFTLGETDEFGYSIVRDPVHVHDLNATLLHLLGIDHERLTFKYQGRKFRLTDVHGEVIRALLG